MKEIEEERIVEAARTTLSCGWAYRMAMFATGVVLCTAAVWLTALILCDFMPEYALTKEFGAGLVLGLFFVSLGVGGATAIVIGLRSLPSNLAERRLLVKYHDELKNTHRESNQPSDRTR